MATNFHVYSAPINFTTNGQPLAGNGGTHPAIPISSSDPDSTPKLLEPADQFSPPVRTYIRVAMFPGTMLGTKPSFYLKASATPGIPTEEGSETLLSFTMPGDAPTPIQNKSAPGSNVASVNVFDEANNIYRIEINIYKPGTSRWEFRIQNKDNNPRIFTFVVAQNDAASKQPWIHIQPLVELRPSVLVKKVDNPLVVTVNNYGTGPLKINDLAGSLLGGGFKLGTPLLAGGTSVNPNSNQNLNVLFNAPDTPQESSTLYTVNVVDPAHPELSDPKTVAGSPGHNNQVTLKAKAGQLEVVLLLDTSGSMGGKPNGDPTQNANETRLSDLKLAGQQFIQLMMNFAGGRGRIGIAQFPASGPTNNFDIQPPVDIDNVNTQTLIGKLNATTPSNSTPMGDGIGHVIGTTSASFGYFNSDNPSQLYNQRWVVLMSDGDNNSGTQPPQDFYPKMPASGISFVDKKVDFFTVAYGNTASVNHKLLQEIADKSGGQAWLADTVSDPNLTNPNPQSLMQLRKQFRAAIADKLALESSRDPGGVLTSAAPEVRSQVTVTPYDTQVAFILDWDTFRENRLSLQLLTPTCELITPTIAARHPNINYYSSPRYQMYIIQEEYLRNVQPSEASNFSNSRYGLWTLIISFGESDSDSGGETGGINLRSAAIDREPHEYEVITESRLNLRLELNQDRYHAGDSIEVTAHLTVEGRPLQNAAVTLNLETPGQSLHNWLATIKITDEEFARAAEALRGRDINELGIKEYAARLKGLTFDKFAKSIAIPMTDPNHGGVYKATFTQTSTPDTYRFYVTATALSEEGIFLRREKRPEVRVGVRPDPKKTILSIQYRQDGNLRFADIKFSVRDSFGNVQLIDPTIDPSFALTTTAGQFINALSGVSDRHVYDGSYMQTLQYPSNATPILGLQVDGVDIIPGGYPLPPSDTSAERLHYVNQVISVKLGGEDQPGANQHPDPQAILGDPFTKPQDRFFSTGSFGSVTVRVTGEVITATEAGQEVWVFVHPDVELRSYRVEALPFGFKDEWVTLGESEGVTQAFSLGTVKLQVVKAIRITDTSGRTRDSDLNVSATPGVSIRGVGVKSKPSGCLGIFVLWWFALLQLLSGSKSL
jgi:hypothetical protein